MNGSEKQITWATQIKTEVLEGIKEDKQYSKMEGNAQFIEALTKLENCEDSKLFIDCFQTGRRDLMTSVKILQSLVTKGYQASSSNPLYQL